MYIRSPSTETASTEIYTLSLHDALPILAVNIHITIIELNALHTKRQNLFQELDAVIHLLMEAKHWKRFCLFVCRALSSKIGRAVQQECRDRYRMPSSA